jgi:hypothetical protein
MAKNDKQTKIILVDLIRDLFKISKGVYNNFIKTPIYEKTLKLYQETRPKKIYAEF